MVVRAAVRLIQPRTTLSRSRDIAPSVRFKRCHILRESVPPTRAPHHHTLHTAKPATFAGDYIKFLVHPSPIEEKVLPGLREFDKFRALQNGAREASASVGQEQISRSCSYGPRSNGIRCAVDSNPPCARASLPRLELLEHCVCRAMAPAAPARHTHPNFFVRRFSSAVSASRPSSVTVHRRTTAMPDSDADERAGQLRPPRAQRSIGGPSQGPADRQQLAERDQRAPE